MVEKSSQNTRIKEATDGKITASGLIGGKFVKG